MIRIDALGDACPIPVVKTRNAIKEMNGAGTVMTIVDNEIAVQNLTKMAVQKGYQVNSEKISDREYHVTMTVGQGGEEPDKETEIVCASANSANRVVVISQETMGNGDDDLGKALMKGFIYALGEQETLPATILFYNGGAKITAGDGPSIEDLKKMEEEGVEILTCGTCLNHYGLTDSLKVGKVTNMYVIAEKMMNASAIVKP